MNEDEMSTAQSTALSPALRAQGKLIKCGDGLTINSTHVMSMEWDRRHYMNGPGDSVLIIQLSDGAKHRIRHEPHLLGGTDCYAIERSIVEAMNA